MSSAVETPLEIQNVASETVDIDQQEVEDTTTIVTESTQELISLEVTTTLSPSTDLVEELKTVQERLDAIANEEREGADAEKVALEEFGKTTEALISMRKQLSEKKTQLDILDESDSTRSEVQADVDRLTKEVDDMEHQWSATKEVCHREFGPIVEDVAASVTEAKARAEYDIKLLQDQIASLQRQLDAVSIRRKQMAADAEEQQQRLADQGDPIDDDEEEDA